MSGKGFEIRESWDGYLFTIKRKADMDALGRHEWLPINYLSELARAFRKQKTLFVDVGANVGMYSVRLFPYYGKVISIEPDPENFSTLKQNIELNFGHSYKLDAILLNVAVSDMKGKAAIKCDGVGSRIIERIRPGMELPEFNENVKVIPLERLDELLPSIIDIDSYDLIAVKVDVEGHEEKVIKGAEELIGKYPIVWLIEHHEYRGFNIKGSRERIINYLKKDYWAINFNQVQWLYAPKFMNPELFSVPVACHWIYKCIENIKSGKPWYFGLPYEWWHGKSMMDFYETLKLVAGKEPLWFFKL